MIAMLAKNIIRPVKIGLRLTGIWPSAYENFFRLFWVLMMSPTLFIQYWYVKNRFNSENLVDLIECVSCAMPYALTFLKLIIFWTKRRVFKTILITMDADWDNTSITKENVDTMVEKVKLTNRCSQLILSMYVCAVLMYSIVYINGIRSTGHNNISPESAELLIKMELPSAAYERLNFQYIIIAQICQLLLVAFAIATVDALLITLVIPSRCAMPLCGNPAHALLVLTICCIPLNTKQDGDITSLPAFSPNLPIYTNVFSFIIFCNTMPLPFGIFSALLLMVVSGNVFNHYDFTADLSFDTTASPAYELVVTEQILHLLSSSLTFGTFGSLLLMTTLHVGCHVDVLCNRFSDPFVIDKEYIRFLIIRQQEITIFVKKLEQYFTYIALAQLLSNTFVTCCTSYLIVSALGLEDAVPVLLKCIMFYYVICLDLYIYCFVGEFLNTKSEMIAEVAYGMPWYDLDPKVTRQLVLLILTAQEGLPLTFGKFSKLNLESFTSIMKASASYMSVLLAMS